MTTSDLTAAQLVSFNIGKQSGATRISEIVRSISDSWPAKDVAAAFAKSSALTEIARSIGEPTIIQQLSAHLKFVDSMAGAAELAKAARAASDAMTLTNLKTPAEPGSAMAALQKTLKSESLVRTATRAKSVTGVAPAEFNGRLADIGIYMNRPPTGPRSTQSTRPAPARDRPVRSRPAVRAFLARVHPMATEMFDAVYDARDRPNGISNAANSAAELLRTVAEELVPSRDVWLYMRQQGEPVKSISGKTRPPKIFHYALIAVRYHIDSTTLMLLTSDGGLANHFEDLKHDSKRMRRADARDELLELTDQLEALIAFLATELAH